MTQLTLTRGLAILTCCAAAGTVAACEGRTTPAPAGQHVTAETPAPSPSPQSSASASVKPGYPSLPIAAKDKILVPPMSGSKAGRTPNFPVTQQKFTVRAACTGKGTVLIKVHGGSMSVPCDGNARRVHVGTDQKVASVTVTPSDTARWTIAVVLTDDFSTVAPTTLAAA
jgi:hypothetical protein